jgi:amino acid transporter
MKDANEGNETVVVDAEVGELAETSGGRTLDDGLHRGLKNRHLQMIALGGVVGCVLFVICIPIES